MQIFANCTEQSKFPFLCIHSMSRSEHIKKLWLFAVETCDIKIEIPQYIISVLYWFSNASLFIKCIKWSFDVECPFKFYYKYYWIISL